MNEEIVKIREAIWSMFPNMATIRVNEISHTKEITTGEITIGLLNGQIKILLISYLPKEDKLEIKER